MNYTQKSRDFISKISEVINQYQFDFNTPDTRLRICQDLQSLFSIELDEYWQSSGIHPSDLSFVDLTTPEMSYQSMYNINIGVSIRNQDPITLSYFIGKYFGIEAIRDKKMREILE